jgi:hypothetical protein
MLFYIIILVAVSDPPGLAPARSGKVRLSEPRRCTTNMKGMYTAEDKERLGKPYPLHAQLGGFGSLAQTLFMVPQIRAPNSAGLCLLGSQP